MISIILLILDRIENCFPDIPVCENKIPQQVPKNYYEESLVPTPMPRPCMVFGDSKVSLTIWVRVVIFFLTPPWDQAH